MVSGLNKVDLKEFLDEKYQEYNNVNFIDQDPIQIPHLYTEKKDIEIAGFLTSIISWGNRKSIINNAKKMMNLLDDSPYDFIKNCKDSEINNVNNACLQLLKVSISKLLKCLNQKDKT